MNMHTAIQNYREPKHGCVSIFENPRDNSCDNTGLFTAMWMVYDDDIRVADVAWYREWLNKLITDQGVIRHPENTAWTSYDDILGMFAALHILGLRDIIQRVYGILVSRGWKNGDNWLGRFPHFVAFVSHCAGKNIGIIGQLCIAGALLQSVIESKGETSGKQMLYLMYRVMKDSYGFLGACFRIWARYIVKIYGGMEGIEAIYFGPQHPFCKYAPKI